MYPNQTREYPPILTPELKMHTNIPKGFKQVGRWQAIQDKRKIIRITSIKTDYNPFQSPLISIHSPDQLVLGRYLPRFISHNPREFSC